MYCDVKESTICDFDSVLIIILAGLEQHGVRIPSSNARFSIYINHFVLRITQYNPHGFIRD